MARDKEAGSARRSIPKRGLWQSALRGLILVVVCGFLAACGSRSEGMLAAAKVIFKFGPDSADVATLNPSFRYLRVMIDERTLLLVLGYVDADPLGPVEVWYSASSEVLRLQNGHVVGLTGTGDEWRRVQMLGVPKWPDTSASPSPEVFTRVRDVMPGYRFGIRDSLALGPIAAPARSNLAILKSSDLRWFEVVEESGKLPPARFALSGSGQGVTVVYSEQCISRGLCLSWQRWPAVPGP